MEETSLNAVKRPPIMGISNIKIRWRPHVAAAVRREIMAGTPARLDSPIEPAGAPPRDLEDPGLLALPAELLKRLSRAKEAAA